VPTFHNSTGPTAVKRRRAANKKKRAAAIIAASPTATKAKKPRTRQPSKKSFSPAKPQPVATTAPPRTTGARTRALTKATALAAAVTPTEASEAGCDILPHYALHSTAINIDTGAIAEYRELLLSSEGPLWMDSMCDEMGRLMTGRGPESSMPTGTETMVAIAYEDIPKGRFATYPRIVVADRPEKENPRRVRLTLGGDKVDYPGKVSTHTADTTTCKIMFNSVISTPGARFMTGDLKDFYLGTPMDRPEFVAIPVELIPKEIMDRYNLWPKVKNGKVYFRVDKGMYGLPQAGRLAWERLVAFLAPHGYRPVPITAGLWKHDTRDLAFTLVVDDFGVKYVKRDDAVHLMTTLKELYIVSEDWEGKRYCGLTLDWDYEKRTCDISMPGYVERALQRFAHPAPSRPEHSPHEWQEPQYGRKVQYAPDPDTTPPLDKDLIKRVQAISGVLLFYSRQVDPTILMALSEISTQQAKPTAKTMDKVVKLLNYLATHPDASVRFVASDMVLWTDSDASYLTAPKARSRAGGYHFLSSKPPNGRAPTNDDPPPPDNGAVLVLCKIMREVLSSAAEAESGGLFLNGKEAVPIRITLEELGHEQPPTPLQTDNNTASGIANDDVKQKRSKAMDMRFYWVQDRVRQ